MAKVVRGVGIAAVAAVMASAGQAMAAEGASIQSLPMPDTFGSALLKPGQTYRNTIVYRLTTGQPRRR